MTQKTTLMSLVLLAGINHPALAQETADTQKDATEVRDAAVQQLYSYPNAQYAFTGGHASTADQAANANTADFATNSANAETADLATDSVRLNGHQATFYRNASNINAGTLSSARLVGSVLDGSYHVYVSMLSGTYNINITGNAASANYANTAGSANRCTGGPSDCDY